MRFLAQFHPEGTAALRPTSQPFWFDALRTEMWLGENSIVVPTPMLTMRSRSLQRLRPWWDRFPATLLVEGKFRDLPVADAWRLFQTFLGQDRMQDVTIRVGGDAHVVQSARRLQIRAPHTSPVWGTLADLWDPAAWATESELEWWLYDRPQEARRYSWGTYLNRRWRTGISELVLAVDEAHTALFEELWLLLARAMGHRQVTMRWTEERMPVAERLLGVDYHLVWTELRSTPDELPPWEALPEPWGLQVQLSWPHVRWSPYWDVDFYLRRLRAGRGFDATYHLQGDAVPDAFRALRRDQRQLPIQVLRHLGEPQNHLEAGDLFDLAEREARAWTEVHRAARDIRQTLRKSPRMPLRVPHWLQHSGWMPLGFVADPYVWLLYHPELECFFEVHRPHAAHPGTIAVEWPGGIRATLADLDPEAQIDRWNRDWKYWLGVAQGVVLPALHKARQGSGEASASEAPAPRKESSGP